MKGTWDGSVLQGVGTCTTPEGDCYEGEFDENNAYTQGTMTYASGDVYTGGWLDDEHHGVGKLTYSDRCVFEGHFACGLKEGPGRCTDDSGTVLTGEWVNGEISTGDVVFTDGRKYSGSLSESDGSIYLDGEGTMTLKNGRVLQGTAVPVHMIWFICNVVLHDRHVG